MLASAELGDDGTQDKRPTVQVGDPFEEKKLLECSLELLERGLLVSLQDLGAAGLTSSASEMASKGEVGIDIDVAAVPLRERRHGAVRDDGHRVPGADAVRGRARATSTRCSRCARSGRSAARRSARSPTRGRMRVLRDGELVGDMPVAALVDDCPLYDLAPAKPAAAALPAAAAPCSRADASARESLLALLACPNLASRRPLFEQYDAIVQSRTVRRPEQADAAVLALPDGSALAVSHRLQRPPRRGRPLPRHDRGRARVRREPRLRRRRAARHDQQPQLRQPREAAHRLAADASRCAASARPAARCEAPIVGGNVSLYNEGATGPIYPTPVIGMVGRLPDGGRAGRLGFARAGDAIALVGPFAPSLAASELAKLRGQRAPRRPAGDRPRGGALAPTAPSATRCALGALASAHDIAEGGLAVALAECCLAGGLGAEVALGEAGGARRGGGAGAEPLAGVDAREALFGEGPGGFLVSGPAERRARARAPHAACA